VTCPVRLRQDLAILADAARFFFPNKHYVAMTEARLKDKHGKSAGNIDIVLAAIDGHSKVVDFGAVEVQAVYISGNVRNVFRGYMKDPAANYAMEWPSKNYPSPDYLSSSRKRLVPQLMFKGGILHEWGKKMAIVVHRGFFDQLPPLRAVGELNADLAWLIYDLSYDSTTNRYNLRRSRIKYTKFEDVLSTIATPTVGNVSEFVKYLEGRIRRGKFPGAPTPSSLEPTVEPLPNSLDDEE
jgi:hypothetical protein